MNIRIKKLHPGAMVPEYATPGAAGFDLVAVEDVIIAPGETKKIPLGLAFEIPDGYVLLIVPRSGVSLRTKLRQPNSVGVIDPDFRGEVAMMFDNTRPLDELHETRFIETIGGDMIRIDGDLYPEGTYIIRKSDRIAQGVIAPVIRATFDVVDELSETERGEGGFGSSGVRVEVSE